MTAAEVYELTTAGGATDFQRVIRACEQFNYCLIGGLAVNCYVEPVYTLDADLVLVAHALPDVTKRLSMLDFAVAVHTHSVNATPPASDLRIQFTRDMRYQAFLPRSVEHTVLGERIRVACLEDVVQGKLWAYGDPARRLSKRKKDELDLIRLAEAYPHLLSRYPESLRRQFAQ